MTFKREETEDLILAHVSEIDPSGRNTEMYRQLFARLSDENFHEWMLSIQREEDYIGLVLDNLNDSKVTVDNNLAIAPKWGVEFFQRIWTTDAATGRTYLSNQKYLIMDLPARRQIQTLVHKMSIPDDNTHIDELSDQPTGVSKGSSISYPEMLALYAQGLDSGVTELMKVRGGDLTAMVAIDRSIHETGSAALAQVSHIGTRTKSTQTLSTLFKAMHIENNF